MASPASRRESLATDLRWGVGWALGFASIYSLYVGGIALLRGSEPFDRAGLGLAAIVRTYFVVALVAGSLLGLLRPLTRQRVGAALVGALCGTAVYTGVGIAIYGVRPLTFIVGITIGVPMGALLARSWSKKSADDAPAAT